MTLDETLAEIEAYSLDAERDAHGMAAHVCSIHVPRLIAALRELAADFDAYGFSGQGGRERMIAGRIARIAAILRGEKP